MVQFIFSTLSLILHFHPRSISLNGMNRNITFMGLIFPKLHVRMPMSRYFLLFIISNIFSCFLSSSYSQETQQIAQTQMVFLGIPVGGRYTGMGSAAVGISEGTEAVFFNPAGLAFASNDWEIFVSETNYIADIKQTAVAVAKGINTIGTFAATAVFMDYGEFVRTVRTDNPNQPYLNLGNFSPFSLAIGLAYARRHTDRFYFGGHVKVVHENLGISRLGLDEEGTDISLGYRDVQNKLTVIAFDFGTRYYPGLGDLNISASWQNFSGEKSYAQQSFSLPLFINLGLSMNVLSLLNDQAVIPHRLSFAFDFVSTKDFGNKYHSGVEYCFKNMFSLRCGYKFGYSEESFTAGFGFRLMKKADYAIGMDYSFSEYGIFNDVHRISLLIHK